MTSWRTAALALAACVLTLAAPAAAQEIWPQKQVTFLVPYTAGGSADILARVLGPHLQEKFGQPFIVENRSGAGGSTGTIIGARAPADGYTIVIGTLSSHVINQLIYKKLQLDTEQSFVPVALLAKLPNLLCVRPGLPVGNVPELLAYLKANPNQVTFGSSGIGTSSHLSAELLKQVTGTSMVHVPFKSANESANALVGGHIDIDFDNMSLLWPLAQGGAVRPLAVSTLQRNPAAPEVPALTETLPGFEVTAWFGMFAPAGTPPTIIDRLAMETKRILELPAVRQQLLETGTIPTPLGPGPSAEFIKAERARWKETIVRAGIEVE